MTDRSAAPHRHVPAHHDDAVGDPALHHQVSADHDDVVPRIVRAHGDTLEDGHLLSTGLGGGKSIGAAQSLCQRGQPRGGDQTTADDENSNNG